MKELVFLAIGALSLFRLSSAGVPFPKSVASSQENIVRDVLLTLTETDPTKTTLFAYRTNSPVELWGYGFFGTGPANPTLPIEQRQFYYMLPPGTKAHAVLDTSFKEFLSQTKYELAYICQRDDYKLYMGTAHLLWNSEQARDRKWWYTKFGEMMVTWG
ncbi:MAG: hypothetical protein M1829_006061 [Trizodia sp. TS-e1964]|nr:MAG: hypothetical protein M1829_006061 [Trizodia sp. TS-e1964]